MRKKSLRLITIYLLSWLIILPSFAWDATGHRLIAWIAYQQLTPATKAHVDSLTAVLDPDYPPLQRFLFASVVADKLRSQNITVYNNWHFINLPWSVDGTPTQPPAPENVVWAIKKNTRVLQDTNATPRQQAIALRFLIHFVGDAHQPLHCINRFTPAFPKGDEGGNLFLIDDQKTPDLHKLWDQGAGLFRRFSPYYPLSTRQVKYLGRYLQKRYPATTMQTEIHDQNPQDWAEASYQLAKTTAYNLKEGTRPSAAYLATAQQVAGSQVALAGYRLAYLLNHLTW